MSKKGDTLQSCRASASSKGAAVAHTRKNSHDAQVTDEQKGGHTPELPHNHKQQRSGWLTHAEQLTEHWHTPELPHRYTSSRGAAGTDKQSNSRDAQVHQECRALWRHCQPRISRRSISRGYGAAGKHGAVMRELGAGVAHSAGKGTGGFGVSWQPLIHLRHKCECMHNLKQRLR
eukprot:1160428-Pelagomonas_calceolata.AAC.7